KNRLETGLSFTEFSYHLLQAYDFQVLYDKYECVLQMGGSDQWGNITSGTEFIRRNCDGKAYAITTPLLTKSDGKKFGKSEEGNVWLDPNLTSPYKFYQFWLNVDDADLYKFLKYFTLKTEEEVKIISENYAENPNEVKKILAEELTVRVHGHDSLKSVKNVTELLFGQNENKDYVRKLSWEDFSLIEKEIPSFTLSEVESESPLIEILVEITKIFNSKSEARRALQNKALNLNKTKLLEIDNKIDTSVWALGQYIILENGKKNKYLFKKQEKFLKNLL
ncbi:MAG TPA: tyrosine--tRNA ligase, partial [Saprospiraceae bacterium]|nr:tyrosine--tRNA ligase [Saprospiraceae bacterium]